MTKWHDSINKTFSFDWGETPQEKRWYKNACIYGVRTGLPSFVPGAQNCEMCTLFGRCTYFFPPALLLFFFPTDAGLATAERHNEWPGQEGISSSFPSCEMAV